MQGAVSLAKFKYYPDVHDKPRYDLGVVLGHCRAQSFQLMESQRCMFINSTFNVVLIQNFCVLSKEANTCNHCQVLAQYYTTAMTPSPWA